MAQIIDSKVFAGSQLNSNTAIEFMEPSDLIDGVNVRVHTEEGNKQGLVITLEGNRAITRDLPEGENRVLRAKEFPKDGVAYLFTKNSNGFHRIESYSPQTELFTTIYEDKTNSNDIQLLDWGEVEYIKDVALVQNRYLYWTEFPTDIVRRVDLLNNYTTFTAEDFHIGVKPPSWAPSSQFISDVGFNGNNLHGLYQFRYRYVYETGSYSTWSPISNRALPDNTSNRPDGVRSNNGVLVTVPLNQGGRYTGIQISHREGNGDWVLTKELTKAYIDALPAYLIPLPPDPPPAPPTPPDPYQKEGRSFGVDIPGDPYIPPGYTFVFYNNGSYITMDQLEHQQLSDLIPRNTRALEVVNDNAILLGNNRVGYPEVAWNPSNYGATIVNETIDTSSTPALFKIERSYTEWGSFEDGFPKTYHITASGNPAAGDKIMGKVAKKLSNQADVEYIVSGSAVGSRQQALTEWVTLAASTLSLTANIIGWTTTTNTTTISFKVTGPDYEWFSIFNPRTDIAPLSLQSSVYPTIKQNSSYQVAVAHYDEFGRPFGIVTGESFKVKTPSMARLGTTIDAPVVSTIQWNIPFSAPMGAAYYTILLSENLTHQTSIYINAAPEPSNNSEDLVLDIKSLADHIDENGAKTLAYEYTPGDQVTIVGNLDNVGNLINHQTTPSEITLPVKGFEIWVDEDNPQNIKHLLTVAQPHSSLQVDLTQPLLIEVYTPKTTGSGGVFYEVSGPYRISGGVHEVTSGVIKYADSFIKLRNFKFPENRHPDVVTWVEDLNYREDEVSPWYNLGRPRIEKDTPTNVVFPAEIRYSREWVSGSLINNINRFYPEDIYDSREPLFGAQETYGGIQYLTNRENRLICVQESKVGYAPVNRSIIEDMEEQQQIGISSKLLNPMNYYAGANIGIGRDYAIPSYHYSNGAAYFIDPFNHDLVRAGIDGSRFVSGRYSGKLSSKIKSAVDNQEYIYSLFDKRHYEVLIVFIDENLTFSEGVGGFTPRKPYLPEGGFTMSDRFYTLHSGQLYIHDDEENRGSFYGVNYPATLTFAVHSPGVKHYQSIEVHADDIIPTVEEGIQTQLNQISELSYLTDYQDRGYNVYTSNFLRDINSPGGLIEGDRLTGRWIKFTLQIPAGKVGEPMPEVNLLKLIVKSTRAQGNIY